MSNSQTPEPATERTLRSSVRNPRRRQRDADSLKTAPRRKRSKISENTFMPPREEEEEVNGTIEVASMNGKISPTSPRRGRGRPRKEVAPVLDVTIPVREKKNSVKRPSRGDGATVLTQNSRYSVKMLPSTPKELQGEGVEYRGSLSAAHHALAVTRERAYIWDYTSHTATLSSPRVFDVPFGIKSTEPLPFGALVTTGNSVDTGLILISATTGKVVFYESIERAASLGLFQEGSTGVEGSIGSLFNGERVVDLTSADHAGFIVTFSSGRIAQLTLRDAQGKARVFGHFLRATEQTSGGLFGSIKGMLGGASWKRDVTAVKTRPLGTRGQVQAIALTERAEVLIWDLDWSGRYTYKGLIDCREVITEELKKLESPEMQGQAESTATLDFAILQRPTSNNEVATLGTEHAIDIVVLVRVGTMDKHRYALVEMTLQGSEGSIGQISELNTYQSRSPQAKQSKPRLLLPKPQRTGLVAFPDAIVVAAMDDSETNSPEAQLHASYVQPQTFEDTIYLKAGGRFPVLDTCEEESKGGHSSSIVFIKGAGLVRITATDSTTSDRESRIPIKTKIEQAVFRGALQSDNIIDFSRVDDSMLSLEDIESAALEISGEILRSTSSFIATTPTSIDAHLTYKAQALRALASHVRQNYPTLSKPTMWRLLWDAEKVAAAQQMWKTFDGHVAACSEKKRTATLFDEVCAIVQQRPDLEMQEVPGGDEPVRTFFIHSVHRIERFLPMAADFLKLLPDETDKSPQTKVRLVKEAGDLWNNALETVFTFRAENAATYGLLPEFIEDGVLTDVTEYMDIPEFWTSTESMLKAVLSMCKVSRELAMEEYESVQGNAESNESLRDVVQAVGKENPRLIQLLCLIYQERINWLASRPSKRDQELSEKLRMNYENTRYEQFRALATVAQADAGLRLAEKYKDMHTLTDMIVAEMQFSLETLRETTVEDEKNEILDYIEQLNRRVGKYFDRFGDEWANAYFDEGFSGGQAGHMLREAQGNWQDALTRYLRADPSRAKICWINDITADKDFAHAKECLAVAAEYQETRLWAKKVELSMSKLTLLATQEGLQADGHGMSERELLTAVREGDLEIVQIQEQLYDHLKPEVLHCIDRQAELEVAMQKFAHKNQDLHSLRQLLEAYLARILDNAVLSAEDLIDALTLMDSWISDDDGNLQGAEFYLALQVLSAAAPSMHQAHVETQLKLIWKRCYIYDDWIAINSAQKQSDDDLRQTLKETAAWHTLYYAINEGFFDSPDCHVRHLLPSECLEAGCLPNDLSYSFPEPDILDAILHDNKIQDEQLQGYVTDRRLDEWIENCYSSVNQTIEGEADDTAERLQRERDFEESVDYADTNGMKANGHVKGSNGIKVEEDGDHSAFLADEDGDVEME